MSLKVMPELPGGKELIMVEKLKTGAFFVARGSIWQLYDEDPEAQNLMTGETGSFDGYDLVLPVDVELRWTKRTKAKTKKK